MDRIESHDHNGPKNQIFSFRKISRQEKREIYDKQKNELALNIPEEIEAMILEAPFESPQSMIEKMIFVDHQIQVSKNRDFEKFKEYFRPPKSNVLLPLFGTAVSCGFTSPADDYIEKHLSLDAELVPNPASTFFVRASGDCMKATIESGDLLVIDRSQEARDGKIILAILDGEFTVKRFMKSKDGLILRPDNPLYNDIAITPERDFEVWGVVTFVIHKPD